MASCSSSTEKLPDPDGVYLEQDKAMLKISNDDTSCCGCDDAAGNQANYILGTLIVRVVAARGLQPVVKGGLAGFLFGNKGNDRMSASGGSANPYAFLSLSVGSTTTPRQYQRTSTVCNSVNPVWSRSDDFYYFDISLPVPDLVAEEGANAAEQKKAGKKKTFDPVKLPQHSASTKQVHNQHLLSITGLFPVVTLQMFHEHREFSGRQTQEKYPSKVSDDVSGKGSRDVFLGECHINILDILTGRLPCFDEWISLVDDNKDEEYIGEVRVVIEYEPTDSAPRPGDMCRLTSFCQLKDVYPIPAHHVFLVDNVEDNDNVILSYTSPEGWLCTFCVHRYMVVCAVRHQAALEIYQDEILSLVNKFAESPMKGALTDVVKRVPDDGLMDIGIDVALGTQTLLSRWFSGGIDTAMEDLINATNLDGRHSIASFHTSNSATSHDSDSIVDQVSLDLPESETLHEVSSHVFDDDKEALPNMPCCPITGERMRDPVVAADGHTYERSAIARWLQQSGKSPLTGKELPHKELVTNYSLIERCSTDYDAKVPAKKLVEEKEISVTESDLPSSKRHFIGMEQSSHAGGFEINSVSSSDDPSVDLDDENLDLNLSACGLEVADDEQS